MNPELAALVERARRDDGTVSAQHAAFAELVRRFEESAFGWAFRLLRDPVEAQDATQDAFITAWLKLRQLRDPAAFGAWLRRLTMTHCHRRIRASRATEALAHQEIGTPTHVEYERRERQRLLAAAMTKLSERDYRLVVLFYFLGRTVDEIAGALEMPRGTVAKRLHAARIAIRRSLPRAVRSEFQRLQPSPQFMKRVSDGLFDEYVGEYRFADRPDLVLRIEREGGLLVSQGGGQRTVLAPLDDDVFVAAAFDAEGRFQRDRTGRVIGFVYYEFGARLGVADKSPV